MAWPVDDGWSAAAMLSNVARSAVSRILSCCIYAEAVDAYS